jgi:hypothetical protein
MADTWADSAPVTALSAGVLQQLAEAGQWEQIADLLATTNASTLDHEATLAIQAAAILTKLGKTRTLLSVSRSLDSAYVPDPDHDVFGVWVFRFSCQAPLLSTASAGVDVQIDGVSIGQPKLVTEQMLSVPLLGAVGLLITPDHAVCGWVHPGSSVQHVSSSSGGGAPTLVSATEWSFS